MAQKCRLILLRKHSLRTIFSISYSLITALTLLLTGCSSHKKVLHTTFSKEEELKIEKKEVEERLRGEEKKILEEAFKWLDTPYGYGRQEKGKATDCSGMVMVIFDQTIGCKLPRVSAEQAEFCKSVNHNNVKPGDLVFFITNNGNKINHVGIMIDHNKFIHASSHGVVVSTMETEYYKTHFKKFGRVPCLKH